MAYHKLLSGEKKKEIKKVPIERLKCQITLQCKTTFFYTDSRRVFGHLGRGWNTKNRVREAWTDTWLSIKSGEIGHTGPRSEALLAAGLKATNTNPRSTVYLLHVVSNFATFDILMNIQYFKWKQHIINYFHMKLDANPRFILQNE